MSAAPTYAERVHALAGLFDKVGGGREYADSLALVNLHAAVEYFASTHGLEYAATLLAAIHNDLVSQAAFERASTRQ